MPLLSRLFTWPALTATLLLVSRGHTKLTVETSRTSRPCLQPLLKPSRSAVILTPNGSDGVDLSTGTGSGGATTAARVCSGCGAGAGRGAEAIMGCCCAGWGGRGA